MRVNFQPAPTDDCEVKYFENQHGITGPFYRIIFGGITGVEIDLDPQQMGVITKAYGQEESANDHLLQELRATQPTSAWKPRVGDRVLVHSINKDRYWMGWQFPQIAEIVDESAWSEAWKVHIDGHPISDTWYVTYQEVSKLSTQNNSTEVAK